MAGVLPDRDLQRLIDEVRGPLRRLLRNLLRLDRLAKGRGEGDVRDRDVVEDEVEAAGAAFEVVADELGDHLALRDELTASYDRARCLGVSIISKVFFEKCPRLCLGLVRGKGELTKR